MSIYIDMLSLSLIWLIWPGIGSYSLPSAYSDSTTKRPLNIGLAIEAYSGWTAGKSESGPLIFGNSQIGLCKGLAVSELSKSVPSLLLYH